MIHRLSTCLIFMGKVAEFLAFTNEILKSHLKNLQLTELEELGTKMRVYHVFQSNFDIEVIYFQLLELFESDNVLRPLLPEILAYKKRKLTKQHESS